MERAIFRYRYSVETLGQLDASPDQFGKPGAGPDLVEKQGR